VLGCSCSPHVTSAANGLGGVYWLHPSNKTSGSSPTRAFRPRNRPRSIGMRSRVPSTCSYVPVHRETRLTRERRRDGRGPRPAGALFGVLSSESAGASGKERVLERSSRPRCVLGRTTAWSSTVVPRFGNRMGQPAPQRTARCMGNLRLHRNTPITTRWSPIFAEAMTAVDLNHSPIERFDDHHLQLILDKPE